MKNKSIIVVGDIHGQFETMMALFRQFPKNAKIVAVGDLIDRGPMSKEIIEHFISNKVGSVRGNHEQMLIDDFKLVESCVKRGADPRSLNSMWTEQGGRQTLDSYTDYDMEKTDERGAPERTFNWKTFKEHAYWLDGLPVYLEFPEVKRKDGRHLVVSHSAIGNHWHRRGELDPQKRNNFELNVMWNRKFNIKDTGIFNIFGHTPNDMAIIKKHWANVDTGACYEGGHLRAIQFPEMIVYRQKNIDRKNRFSIY